jgi:hypothetical protein
MLPVAWLWLKPRYPNTQKELSPVAGPTTGKTDGIVAYESAYIEDIELGRARWTLDAIASRDH